MQEEIKMHVPQDKLSNANMRRKLDPLYKNVFRRQNPYKFVFKNVSMFDKQSLITDKLLSETEIGKSNSVQKYLKKHNFLKNWKFEAYSIAFDVLTIDCEVENCHTMTIMTKMIMMTALISISTSIILITIIITTTTTRIAISNILCKTYLMFQIWNDQIQ